MCYRAHARTLRGDDGRLVPDRRAGHGGHRHRGWERTPWHATQAGGVGGVEEGGSLGGCPLRHGFSESALAPEQLGLGLSDQDIGCVAELLAFFHEALRCPPHLLCPGPYLRG